MFQAKVTLLIAIEAFSIWKDKKIVVDRRHKLASNAGQFLVATCVRSVEARKRVFMEIGYVFKYFVDSSEGFRPPESIIQAFVDFINDVLVARTPTGSYISTKASGIIKISR
ncbi:hypothetical protein POM88_001447 [Heracleum sosnowskyi]|uniref:Uncharacterized protein n=1 Tax=Heracleum sosnowskyi TaxID=360622 RepID=A0AAD8JCJ1_9APIA|nr:hypothetical protein POM88_001447 [Heracleum sosnowskyi]